MSLLNTYLSDSLKYLRIARNYYMQFFAENDEDADYLAGKFNDALICVENLKEEVKK